ncbi:MAG TPA: 2-hydroxyacid dehydrogenase [Geminicoccaceae bacterium]|nr:2-hydroxyacid dehydrogenase [Geminicoccus sp.]HMU50448.1 2-hydroxyacid dehydrogenase [Geminicoccaceae bacterium]
MLRVLFQYQATPRLRASLGLLQQQGLDVQPDVDLAGCMAGGRDLLAGAEVFWHVLEPVTAEVIAAMPKLRLIQKIGVGVNTIDLATARARDIAICNMPGTNSRAVAEMTLALMLAALRRLPVLDGATRRGQGWGPVQADVDSYGEVAGRTVGLVGYGAVPRLLAPVLRAMEARVLYWSRTPRPDVVADLRPLDRLIEESDIVSLHLPLTPETEGLIDAGRLARMRPGAILVNTARGGLVDEPALVTALRSGHLSAAGLDVFAQEPLTEVHPMLELPNVVLAPHLAWHTPETVRRSLDVAVENCRRLSAGVPLLHRVQ